MTRRAGVVGGATLASRIAGLARDLVLARLFAFQATDAFFVAFMIPNLFRRLVGEGSLTVSFVPVFTRALQRSPREAQHVFRATWTLALLGGVALAGLGVLAAGPLADLFAPGFAETPGKHELTVALLRWCFPYLALLVGVAVAMGALNSVGHFLAPAAAPILLNLCLIAGAFAGVAWLDVPILALGVAVVVAGALQLAVQLPALRRHGLAPGATWDPGHPALRELGALMLPSVLGASVFQLNLLLSRFLASFLGDGAVSSLYYASRLLELPLGVVVFALGTASLPSFASAVGRADRPALSAGFRSTLGTTLALALPACLGLIALAQPLFALLFGFGGEDAALSARVLVAFAAGLVPIAATRIWVNLCVAHRDTATPARGAVVSLAVFAATALAWLGPLPAGRLPEWLLAAQHRWVWADLGLPGLALASSAAAVANWAYVAARAHRVHGALLTWRDLAGWLRLGLAGAAMLGALAGLAAWLPTGSQTGVGSLARLAVHVVAGALVYLGALAVLRSPELSTLVGALRRRRPTGAHRALQ